MPKVLEKTERRLGEKLFLKADRCLGPKCATVRRASPPGVHGKGRRRGSSEYGKLMQEKQKVRFLYGLDDKDIRRYAKEAALMPGVFSSNFLALLESRLDNVVFRAGFAPSRRVARQMVSHGHILVEKIGSPLPHPPHQGEGKLRNAPREGEGELRNSPHEGKGITRGGRGKVVTIPSYRVKKGELVSIKESSRGLPLFSEIDARLKNYEAPAWMTLDKNKKEAIITGIPQADEALISAEVTKIKEFYSR